MSTLVTIQDTLTLAVGGIPTVGSLSIENPSFTDATGQYHPASLETVYVASNGTFSCHLAPNVGAIPESFYTVTYRLRNGQSESNTEYWLVPSTSATLSIEQVRTNKSVPPLPFQVLVGQLYSATANIGDVLCFNGAGYTPTTVQSVFPFAFTNETQLVIPAGSHNQGSAIVTQVYDPSGNLLDPQINVAPGNGTVTITFGGPTSGYGFIYGGLGRSLPNFSAFFAGTSTAVIPVSQHRFSTRNLVISLYDVNGNLLDGQASINIATNYTVTVTLDAPTSFSVVIVGCLGVDSSLDGNQVVGNAPSNLSATATLNVNTLNDGDTIAIGTVVVINAAVGQVAMVTAPSLPVGCKAFATVTQANTISIEAWNNTGQSITPGPTSFTVVVLSSN